jgi:hypothetical protein
MAEKQSFNMEEEFAGLDFNSSRLEKRFVRTMETLSKQPDKSIWFGSENRAEASETKFPQQYTEWWAMRILIVMKSCGHTGKRPSNG